MKSETPFRSTPAPAGPSGSCPSCRAFYLNELNTEQQALFDLMYSQVLGGDVAAGRQRVQSFDLPYPLKKDAYNTVVELYETSIEPGQYPNHCYRTDDERIVRRASCNRIIHPR